MAVLTPKDLAQRTGVSAATIRNMAARGELPGAFRIGTQWRFPEATLDAITNPSAIIPVCLDESPVSTSPSAQKGRAGTASGGGRTGRTARSADTRHAKTRRPERKESPIGFEATFPEYAAMGYRSVI